MTLQRINHAIKQVVECCILAGLLMLPLAASALDYRSIAPPKAVLFDAPSAQGKKLFAIGQGYPVEVIVDLGDWIKVRDNHGSLSWIEASQLSPKRTVLVTTDSDLRQQANEGSTLVSRVEKDVVLDLLEPAVSGWVKVKHRDGLVGYISSSSVWGL
jgi:SH3-like domain-containing protein